MIAKKLEFQMRFGLSLPGFAMTPGSIEYYPGCKPEGPSGPPQDAPDGPPAGGSERGDGPAPEMPAPTGSAACGTSTSSPWRKKTASSRAS